jgi:Ca-activated chloride channel homolog
MSRSVRLVPSLAVLSFLTGLSAAAVAQTSINDVHITPREQGIAVAAPSLASNLPVGSLIRASVNLVMVPVTITDAMNRPVVGLGQNNFELYENKKPQEIKHFSSEDTPISVGIIVDTSGSMNYKLDRAREAVAEFCDIANPNDEFFMITFADTPRLATDFTTRQEQIENDLLTARSKGRTSLLDAIYMGVRKMRNARYSRRALLIISDGGDNHSRYSDHDVKAAVKEADVLIYAVGTFDRYVNTQEELMGPELLRSITGLTGGQTFTLSNVNEMPAVTRAIGTQLRHQYMLAYEPQSKPKDGKWHKISVKLRLPNKLQHFLHVDARAGYYGGGE